MEKPPRRYAYLHGFGSGPESKKGRAFADRFAKSGVVMERPDLNKPDFAHMSAAAALEAVDAMVAAGGDHGAWCFVGSSLGGWLAARWAQLHPERVDRLVLLCPGFDLASRWPKLVGPERMARWKSEGTLLFPDVEGRPVPVHYAFYEEGVRLPPFPDAPCPTLIFHGVDDAVVPVESSRVYARGRPHVTLVELADEHPLLASLPRLLEESLRFFGLARDL